ncbi:MAG: hypothetical protein MHMPM18_004000, partial [Marteilia pararefringens]
PTDFCEAIAYFYCRTNLIRKFASKELLRHFSFHLNKYLKSCSKRSAEKDVQEMQMRQQIPRHPAQIQALPEKITFFQ